MELILDRGEEKVHFTLDGMNSKDSEQWSNILRRFQTANVDPQALLKLVKAFLANLKETIDFCPMYINIRFDFH